MRDLVVLASASPRRRELLSLILEDFSIKTSSVDEMEFLTDSSPLSVEQAALAKARDVARECDSGSVIIAADTVISFRGRLLGKPESIEHAAAMLRELRGVQHQVITGCAVIPGTGSTEYLFHESTAVRMKEFSEGEILDYVASGEPFDKAGAYAIQGLGGSLIHSIQGCYPNVIGFPMCAVVKHLRLAGIETRPVQDICPARRASGWSCQLQ